MNALTPPLAAPAPVDDDLAEQARPGHGIPSQDPDPAAQLPLAAGEAAREARSVLVAGGLMAGAATGATVGVLVAGPVGVLVGATLGAVAGVVGGAVGGAMGGAIDSAAEPVAASPETTPGTPASLATAASVRLHTEDSGGSGRPVLLIHGWPLSAQAWQPQRAALQAAGYRVVSYDRRGFGRSDKPDSGYGYDTLADDLQRVIDACALQAVTLVGFSMGGGEVARYISRFGESRLHSVVFAAAVPPYLLQTTDNPEGPLKPAVAQQMKQQLERDREAFFEQFTRDFFAADGVPQVSEAQRAEALALCRQSAPQAALACMEAFASTDFRDDLKAITVPTLVLHGDADAIVPIEGAGLRTHRAVPHSRLVRIAGAPHGLNLSHAPAFNDALLGFLQR